MKKKRRSHFLIDAYNVIHDWPELIALHDNLEYARDQLIDILAEYGAFEHYKITIVFDALFTDRQESCERIYEHLDVVYTEEGETADSYIEKLAYYLVRQDEEVYVVTSDYAEQSVILGAGAYRISSRELRKDIKKTKKKIAEDYTAHNPINVKRRELGSRIKDDIARKLDELRKRS